MAVSQVPRDAYRRERRAGERARNPAIRAIRLEAGKRGICRRRLESGVPENGAISLGRQPERSQAASWDTCAAASSPTGRARPASSGMVKMHELFRIGRCKSETLTPQSAVAQGNFWYSAVQRTRVRYRWGGNHPAAAPGNLSDSPSDRECSCASGKKSVHGICMTLAVDDRSRGNAGLVGNAEAFAVPRIKKFGRSHTDRPDPVQCRIAWEEAGAAGSGNEPYAKHQVSPASGGAGFPAIRSISAFHFSGISRPK